MTFAKFEKIVKDRYPNAKVFRHGEFAGNKINVAVIFDEFSKVYKFNGTYVEVLNKLGIRSVYSYQVENLKMEIAALEKSDGEEDFFGGTFDNSAEIAEHKARLYDILKNCIVC